MKTPSVLLLLALAGCASYTGVVPTGADAYMAGGTGSGSSSHEVTARLYHDASAYCTAQSKDVKTITLADRPGNFGRRGSARLDFTCVPKP